MLFLPPYSPDLNPIEMAFSELKANFRARAIRNIDDLRQAIGDICDLYPTTECKNYFKAAGYASMHAALVTAKVVLSFYRRLHDAATYFAQGRIAYGE